MKVPLLDLTRQYQQIQDRLTPMLMALLESQQFILGEPVRQFETEMAGYCGVPHTVGVSSGTDALLISLMAIGIQPGDIVITSPYTFFATAGVIARLGAIPLFVDIEPCTFTIDPAKLAETIDALKPSERKRLKAIIPIHLFGQCADMRPIIEIAGTFHLAIIEDAAQAIGAEYEGRRAGSMGDYGCFSFFPSKNLGGFGDGGLVSTRSESDQDRLVRLRVHGGAERYSHTEIGGNFRLDALQALVLSVKLAYLDEWTAMRRDNASRYRMLFADIGLLEHVTLPIEVNGKHVFNQFVIRAPRHRNALQGYLAENDIGTAIYYPIPLHLQPCFAYLGKQVGDFPQSEQAAGETLALPVFPELEPVQIERVVDIIAKYFRHHA